MKTLASLALLLAALSAGAQTQPPTSAAPVPAPSASPVRLQLPPATDPGVQKAEQILQQMVEALGGSAYLNLQNVTQQGRTYGFDSQGRSDSVGAPFTRSWRWPDQERVELTSERPSVWMSTPVGIPVPIPIDKKGHYTLIFSGEQAFEISDQGVTSLDKELADDYLRRRAHSLPWVLRKWLAEPGIAIFYEGQVLAERKQADQISLLTAKNDSVTIAVDSTAHLPIRLSFTWRDPQFHDKNEDGETYENYKPIQGIMTPISITRFHNGQPRNQRFLDSTKYNEAVPATLFDPKAPAPTPAKGKKK